MGAGSINASNLLYKLVTSDRLLIKYSDCHDMQALLNGLAVDLDTKGLTSEQLLTVMLQGRDQPLPLSLSHLKPLWMPGGYDMKRQHLLWRLRPKNIPFAPFYDQQLSQVSGASLLSSLLRPASELQSLLEKSANVKPVRPAGFIFHLSRCGSTLLSNALAAAGGVQVISEASFLTNLLLDKQLSPTQKMTAMRVLLSLFELPPIIKFNAWDTGFLPLIREAFPQTPMVFLIREPLRILASHRRMSGIQMVPGNPVADYLAVAENGSLFDYYLNP
jgi:hypothetical protein